MDRQYLELLKAIKEKGTVKGEARDNMPTTKSLFGYQMRHDLSEGFPLLTTKEINFKNIIVELVWFLRGDTNIKFLVDNGFNQWNEDAYNYYVKIASRNTDESWNNIYMGIQDGKRVEKYEPMKVEGYSMFTFEEFIAAIKGNDKKRLSEAYSAHDYTLGDCGWQYGKVWRDFAGQDIKIQKIEFDRNNVPYPKIERVGRLLGIDQIKKVLYSLRNTPNSRRHLVTAVDPAHDEDLALYWCHSMFQFNCREIPFNERIKIAYPNGAASSPPMDMDGWSRFLDLNNIPKYYLDCQLYQRSADVFLGVPYNIASYALLTHIFCKLLNMVEGDYIHTFGDVHIYSNHEEQTDLQLTREPRELPRLSINTEFWNPECAVGDDIEAFLGNIQDDGFINSLINDDILLINYNPHEKIKGKLSTGLKK